MLGQVTIDPSTAIEHASEQGPIVYLVVVTVVILASFKLVSLILMEYPEHKRRLKYYDRMEKGIELLLGMVRKQSKADVLTATRTGRTTAMLERQAEFNSAVASAAGKINARFPQLDIGEEVGRMRAAVKSTRDVPGTTHVMDVIDD